jgi:predicted ATPase
VEPLLLFTVLFGFWTANTIAFNGRAIRELAAQFMVLAEKQSTTAALLTAHRVMGTSLLLTGNIAEGRAHLDRAIALYDPAEHLPLATRFAVDARIAVLAFRSIASWVLGYPEAALADADGALKQARDIDQAAALMYALNGIALLHIHCGDYEAASAAADEVVALAEQKGAPFWKALGMMNKGSVLALTGKTALAVHIITSPLTELRSTGSTVWSPLFSSLLASAHAAIGQFDDAWRRIHESMTVVATAEERWCEAEVYRVAGEIALKLPKPDAAKAEAYFERALAVAREQQAKSWELRAAMSTARLWHDQGKCKEARDLLAPIYGSFTEGFDTHDLKQAKVLLDELVP